MYAYIYVCIYITIIYIYSILSLLLPKALDYCQLLYCLRLQLQCFYFTFILHCVNYHRKLRYLIYTSLIDTIILKSITKVNIRCLSCLLFSCFQKLGQNNCSVILIYFEKDKVWKVWKSFNWALTRKHMMQKSSSR